MRRPPTIDSQTEGEAEANLGFPIGRPKWTGIALTGRGVIDDFFTGQLEPPQGARPEA